jgi:hypothetical protein
MSRVRLETNSLSVPKPGPPACGHAKVQGFKTGLSATRAHAQRGLEHALQVISGFLSVIPSRFA